MKDVTGSVKETVIGLLFVLLSASVITGEPLSYYLPETGSYNPNITTPEEFFGYQVGEWHLRHDQIVDYLYRIADESDRLAIEEYARSYEQRPLVVLTISSEENMGDINSIREQHLGLLNPESSESLDITSMPAVVWLGYSIHGNEPSGSNGSVLVAYHLAAAEGGEIEDILANTVVLLDPAFNPDGLARFAHWANTHRGKQLVADPNNREHNEEWPGGRTNHYWFDLNRDWLLVQHPESQGRIRKFHQWMPNILTDHHEMGTNNTYFMQPGVPARTNPLTPERNQQLTGQIAEYHADALNDLGSLYYSKQGFDDFYYGKGSTYPDINGSIGILFEQASSRGHLQESIHGDLAFPFTIRNHVTTSFSTLRAAQSMRTELLEYQRDFYSNAADEAADTDLKAYIFQSPGDPVRDLHFIRLLRNHDIRVHRLGQTVSVNGNEYQADQAYIIPTNQQQYRLINAMFDVRTTFNDSIFYDVSTWTMPLAFNLDYSEYETRRLDTGLLGEEITTPDIAAGEIIGEPGNRYAYLMTWDGYYAPRALNRILQSDIRAKVAKRQFSMNIQGKSVSFDYGTILFPTSIRRPAQAKLDSVIREINTKDGIDIYRVSTGLTPGGIDLGSGSFAVLEKPRVLIAVGGGVSSYEAGEIWHLLDQRQGMTVSLIEKDRINRINLSDYTTMIFPGGNYNDISSGTVEDMKEWIRDGGTLVTLRHASRWAAEQGLVTVHFRESKGDSIPERRPYIEASNFYGAHALGGAIFETELDLTHPLGYGYHNSRLPVFRQGTLFMHRTENPYDTPLMYTQSPLLSGYIHDQELEQMKDSAAIIARDIGGGSVIMILDRLHFRAYFYGTDKLFMNAIFFGSIL